MKPPTKLIKFNHKLRSMKSSYNNKGYKCKNNIHKEIINYSFNFLTYKNIFNKGFLKLNQVNRTNKKFNTFLQINIYNTKYVNLILASISSVSRKLGEYFIKIPFIFFSNSLSYSSAKNISKKI